jgi:hypothetical protein
MNKINKVIKIEDLPDKAIKALIKQYPEGWKDHVRKITKPNGDFFYAINVDTKEISYLVKVNVKVDSKREIEKLEDYLIDEKAENAAKSHSGDDTDLIIEDSDDDEDDMDDDDD